jgi:hypothetical protein
MSSIVSTVAPRRRHGIFFPAMAVAIAVAVFAGFSRTYYLREWTGSCSSFRRLWWRRTKYVCIGGGGLPPLRWL